MEEDTSGIAEGSTSAFDPLAEQPLATAFQGSRAPSPIADSSSLFRGRM